MGIIIKLYGGIKERISRLNIKYEVPNTLNIEVNNIKTVFDIFKEFNINQNEISIIFVNGKYCGPGKEIKDGDRIGLFPNKMGLMFLEIINSNSINIKLNLYGYLKKIGPAKEFVDLPEGSTIRSILNKFKIPKELGNLRVIVNGKRRYENDFVIENGDTVAFFPPIHKD